MNPIARNLLIGAGILIAARFVFARNAEQKREDALLGFTEDTGIIGSLGAVTNRASGGILADLGSGIGVFFSDIFDRRTVDDLTAANPQMLPADFVGPPS